MYFPEFSITTNILKNIGKIEAAKALIEHTPIASGLLKKLQRETEFKSTFHANHFEGNPLKFDEVKAFFDGIEPSNKKALKEISNYKNTLDNLYRFESINESTLKGLHKNILRDIAPENRLGFYRTSVTVIKGTNVHSPSPDEILAELRSFFTWFEEVDAKDLPAPLRSAILYFEILRIQPFETENKKIAGLITYLNLYLEEYDKYKVLSLENYFDENPSNFFNVMRSTQNTDGDITRWLEYFLKGLANEYTSTKDRVINLAKDNKIMKIAGMQPLNDRQERIVEFMHDYGSMQNKDFMRLFPEVSEDTILRDLKDLMAKEIIMKVGSTKSARYVTKTAQSIES